MRQGLKMYCGYYKPVVTSTLCTAKTINVFYCQYPGCRNYFYKDWGRMSTQGWPAEQRTGPPNPAAGISYICLIHGLCSLFWLALYTVFRKQHHCYYCQPMIQSLLWTEHKQLSVLWGCHWKTWCRYGNAICVLLLLQQARLSTAAPADWLQRSTLRNWRW